MTAAEALRQAIVEALRQFEATTGRRVVAVEVVHDPRTDLADAAINATPSS